MLVNFAIDAIVSRQIGTRDATILPHYSYFARHLPVMQILVVEKNVDVRMLVQMGTELYGQEVALAGSVIDAQIAVSKVLYESFLINCSIALPSGVKLLAELNTIAIQHHDRTAAPAVAWHSSVPEGQNRIRQGFHCSLLNQRD